MSTWEEEKQQLQYMRSVMTVKQQLPYHHKIDMAERRVREFESWACTNDKNTHISVGGLDSITLLLFLRKIGVSAPAISVSSLEDASIQRIHRQLGVENLKPYKTKVQVIRELGYPIISKDKAGKIELLQNPTDKNRTVRHAIMTGETGKQGGYRTGTRMRLPQKWLDLFGGPENETYGTGYQTAPFKVSQKCCYYMKEKPCDDWARKHNSVPYLGLLASEGGQREKALMMHG
jgi:3'-phosphoadenosine 5'-phosphosulfate sulfotransferase (PAPS reductase)/FAD synthetase